VDAVSFSEDLGTQRALMMSPAMFREFILPEYVHAFANVLAAGSWCCSIAAAAWTRWQRTWRASASAS